MRNAPAGKLAHQKGIRRAFTLIELLVVLAVIAVVVSMILPAIGRAQETVKMMVCANNLRQIITATNVYAKDNNGGYPTCAVNPVFEDWVWWHPGRSFMTGGIIPYMGSKDPKKILICPDDEMSIHLGYPNCYPFSYSMNINVGGWLCNGEPPAPPYPGLPCRNMHEIKHPGLCIIFIEESEYTIDDGCWAWQPEYGGGVNLITDRHDQINHELRWDPSNKTAGRGNCAFCDGHVAFTLRSDSFNPIYYDPTK